MLTLDKKDQISEILRSKTTFIFDMDGTIYLGNNPFDYAVRFIDNLRSSGKKVLFFTNNASHDTEFYVDKLGRLGFDATAGEICTSGDVTCTFLNENRKGKSVYLLGTEQLWNQFKRYGIDLINDKRGIPDGREPDIVVSSFDTSLTYEKLSCACGYIMKGAEYISTHPDYNCPTETGFIPDSGSIASAIEASTKVRPMFMGKPYSETAKMLSVITGEEFSKLVLFGDRIYTDIATGRRNGITAVLVLTGESTLEDVVNTEEKERPDIVLESLDDANDLMFN